MASLSCADSLVPEAKPKLDDKASSKASSKPESPAAASAEPGASLKYPSDAKSARPALGGLLRLNAHKDAAAQQVRPSRPRAALCWCSMEIVCTCKRALDISQKERCCKCQHSILELCSGRARKVLDGQACNHRETDLMLIGVCMVYA